MSTLPHDVRQMWRYCDMMLGTCVVHSCVLCAHTLLVSVAMYSVGQCEAVVAALVALSVAYHLLVSTLC